MSRIPLRKYHMSIWVPHNFNEMLRNFIIGLPETLTVSGHCLEEMKSDKITVIPKFKKTVLLTGNIVEAHQMLNLKTKRPISKLSRIVVRISDQHSKFDYTYVISHDGNIITAWANCKSDEHTLRYKKYYTPTRIKHELPSN